MFKTSISSYLNVSGIARPPKNCIVSSNHYTHTQKKTAKHILPINLCNDQNSTLLLQVRRSYSLTYIKKKKKNKEEQTKKRAYV